MPTGQGEGGTLEDDFVGEPGSHRGRVRPPAETRLSIALQVVQCMPEARQGRSTRDKVIYVRICKRRLRPADDSNPER